MRITFYILTFLLISICACKPDNETVINEIIVRDTVYINQIDTLNNEFGGLKIRFGFQNEFGSPIGSVIPGTEIKVANVNDINITEMNAMGEVFISGLVSGRTYGIDVFHKGNHLAILEANRIGSNVYLDYPSFVIVIDISTSVIQTVNANIAIENDSIQGINFSGSIIGTNSDSATTSRGIVVFMSKNNDVNPINHELALGKSQLNTDGSANYSPVVFVPNSLLKSYFNLEIGDTLYYSAHGGSGVVNQEYIAGYISSSHSDHYLGRYPNVNPKGLNGFIIFEK